MKGTISSKKRREFGLRLQIVMAREDISIAMLAEWMDVGYQTVKGWRNGCNFPCIDRFVMLCEIFQVSADYLLFGRGEYHRD